MTKLVSANTVYVFIFLALFPFGQLIRIGIVHPVDVVAGLAAVYTLYARLPVPSFFKYIKNFLLVACFSWIVGLFMFQQVPVLYGLLYLVRLTAYAFFLIYVWNFVKTQKANPLLLNSLLAVSVISAVLGWIQFAVFPDIKPLFIWGWDMHLYRLVGTFFDPGYLGLIIVFGLIVSMYRYIDTRSKKHLVIITFLLVSLAFTYSRASYLAFVVALSVIAIQKHVIKQALVLLLSLVLLILVLPTARNHSVELFRSFSAVARVENYKSTVQIFQKSPLFGVGYDNLCIAYQKYIGYQKLSSHACSGSDSSLLFILATTGVAGLMVLLHGASQVYLGLKRSSNSVILTTCLASLVVHSLFSNSLVYPWILGWMAILLALSV
jgi:O-antigen ligase